MSASTVAPTLIGGRYTVQRELGYGATATVYLCRDREAGAHVAVKVLRVELAESLGAERFLREIRVTAGLQHPNIVPVVDSGADGSILYCVLPYLEGGTLRDRLRESRQLAIPDAVHIGRTIAGALEYAHGKGLIHRDIKPENILFSGGTAFLGDFGIARLLHATQGDLTTTTGVVRGTPAYMSPEQASGERDYDGRSDIYSLACVVYEMVSGMPPFVGPTSQSVLAQRFSSRPRPMSVYRNTVTPDLEAVIDRAMATSPADRYATVKEFADRLAVAGQSTVASVERSAKRLQRSTAAGVAALAFIAVSVIAVNGGAVTRWLPRVDPPVDTTQLAIMPFDRDQSTERLGSVDAFIYDAFSAWKGLTVLEPFRVLDALEKQTTSGLEKDRMVAISLGAGRFVRGSISAMPTGGWRIRAWLHQVLPRSDTLLTRYSLDVQQADLLKIDAIYAKVARALLLRDDDTTAGSLVISTRSLPALQSFTTGIDKVDDWNLPEADSLFQRAINDDPSYHRAYLWQAQIRFWQRLAPEQWSALVEKALLDTSRLPDRDVRLGRALQAIAVGDFDGACDEYDALRRLNGSDFAAWFGMGRCRELDYRIEPDPSSPGTWRYHASYQAAVNSYQRAFEALALSHRGLERGAFEPLRDLLFMRPSQLQRAVPPASDSTKRFVGRLDKAGDTLLMRVIPESLLIAGDPAAVPLGLGRAIESQQQLFRTIAASWSTALPRSTGAKEAVAVALEMRGEPSALDTLRVALSNAAEPVTRLRLGAALIIARLKFADPGDVAEFGSIKRSADSLLGSNPSPNARQAAYLSSIAALTGRCALTAALSARGGSVILRGVPRDVVGAADSLLGRASMGCADNAGGEINRLKRRIAQTAAVPDQAVTGLLLRTVLLLDMVDTSLVAEFAGAGSSYLVRSQAAAIRSDATGARRLLSSVEVARDRTGRDDVAPDAIYLESRVLLILGDTAAAAARLDRMFDRLPYLTPGMLGRPSAMAALVRAMGLRAEIAAARGEKGRALQLGLNKKTLWSGADATRITVAQ